MTRAILWLCACCVVFATFAQGVSELARAFSTLDSFSLSLSLKKTDLPPHKSNPDANRSSLPLLLLFVCVQSPIPSALCHCLATAAHSGHSNLRSMLRTQAWSPKLPMCSTCTVCLLFLFPPPLFPQRMFSKVAGSHHFFSSTCLRRDANGGSGRVYFHIPPRLREPRYPPPFSLFNGLLRVPFVLLTTTTTQLVSSTHIFCDVDSPFPPPSPSLSN